jgi:Glycosyl hydrolases family 2/Glycosyl hydrolases family 2, TIM barrel domain
MRTLTITGRSLLLMLVAVSLNAPLLHGEMHWDMVINGTNWSYQTGGPQSPIPMSGWIPTRVPAPPITDGTVSVWYETTVPVPPSAMPTGHRFVRLQAGHYTAVYCGGQLMGENWGEYAPFTVEITSCPNNTLDFYVHNADSTYAYQGADIDQSTCSFANCLAMSYRSAANTAPERNWVGIIGDVTFSWRPQNYLVSALVVPSVQNMTLGVNVTASGGSSVRATVYDGANPVLKLPPALLVNGAASLSSAWANPTLWSPSNPKLYTLCTQLLQGRRVFDTLCTQFGFRQVWQQGQQVLLNGQPLWMVGDYMTKLAPILTVNDRRPLAMQFYIMQQSGFNTFQSHWDDCGETCYQLADEMGILILGSLYCTGAQAPFVEADSQSAWIAYMESQVTAYTQAYANHPSIIMWRPVDVTPGVVKETTAYADLDAIVAANDPQDRPIADGGSLAESTDYTKFNLPDDVPECPDLTGFEATLAAQTRGLFTKEIYGSQTKPCAAGWFDQLYSLGTLYPADVGMIIQQLFLFVGAQFSITWPSQSGIGNRPTSEPATGNGMPNWLTEQWTPTTWSTQFAGLATWPLIANGPQNGDYVGSTPAGTAIALMTPSSGPETPVAIVPDSQNTAWWVTPWTGTSTLSSYNAIGKLLSVQTVTITARSPY